MVLPQQIGPYTVVRELGRGGMGVVYVVLEPVSGRELALKLLRLSEATPREAERFGREVAALARVQHACVVRILQQGRAPEGPYLVMDLVEGESADELMERGCEPRRAAEITRALCGAVQAVHDLGIVHRDIKPANVMIRPDGQPVLLDFGLAREDSSERLTQTGVSLGTPAFMSPEQAGGKTTGPFSDVYGLGTFLYALVAGEAPFRGTPFQIYKQVIVDEPPDLTSARARGASVAPALGAICARAMAKLPEQRYRNPAAMGQDLQRFLDGEAVGAPAPGASRALILTSVVAVVLIGVALALALGTSSAPSPSPSPSVAAAASPSPTASAPESAPHPFGGPRTYEFVYTRGRLGTSLIIGGTLRFVPEVREEEDEEGKGEKRDKQSELDEVLRADFTRLALHVRLMRDQAPLGCATDQTTGEHELLPALRAVTRGVFRVRWDPVKGRVRVCEGLRTLRDPAIDALPANPSIERLRLGDGGVGFPPVKRLLGVFLSSDLQTRLFNLFLAAQARERPWERRGQVYRLAHTFERWLVPLIAGGDGLSVERGFRPGTKRNRPYNQYPVKAWSRWAEGDFAEGEVVQATTGENATTYRWTMKRVGE